MKDRCCAHADNTALRRTLRGIRRRPDRLFRDVWASIFGHIPERNVVVPASLSRLHLARHFLIRRLKGDSYLRVALDSARIRSLWRLDLHRWATVSSSKRLRLWAES